MTVANFDLHLAFMAAAPKNDAVIEHICIRPTPGTRQVVDRVVLSSTDGVMGDRWKTSAWLRLPNGAPDPRVQVALCSPRLLQLLQGHDDPRCLIGDTFVADLDLSEANLPIGQRLAIGTAVIQVSDIVNDACGKFAHRFGVEPFKWIRKPEHQHLRLRGIFAQVIQDGEVGMGATLHKC